MRKLFFYLLMGFVFISCGEKKKDNSKEEAVEEKKSDSIPEKTEMQIPDSIPLGLEMFTNMEMVPFCIALPLKGYTLDEKQSDEKAKFIFTKNSNPKYYIQVQGLIRSDETVSLEEYFKNSTSEEETEAQGKILEQKVLDKDRNCIWLTGYWSNFPEQKFVELVFLRKEDVVTMYWSYDSETESSDYFIFTQVMMRYGTECKE